MSRILSIPIALLVLLAGAMYWSGGGVERRADFAFINRGDIFTLDLNSMSYMQDFRLTYGIREGLYGPAPKTYRPTAAGAASHEVSPDKKTWTFKLRPEAKWTNGDPVTAHDYVFSWRRLLCEPGEYTYLFYYFKNAKPFEDAYARGDPPTWDSVGIEAVDDHTFRVSLNNPVPYLLDIVAFPPFYPRHERSMAPFRDFIDDDVMGPFVRCVAVVNDPAGDEKALARLLAEIKGRETANAGDVSEFRNAVRGFDLAKATESELLAKLATFAKMDVLPGGGGSQPSESGDYEKLSPKAKLARMLERRFVRYGYDKAYTRPPNVVTNGPYYLKIWDFKRRLYLEKSPTYWDRANVKTDSIEMVVSEAQQNQLLLYETGQVDWNADVNGDQAAELKARGREDLRTSPAFGTMFLSLLCTPELPASIGVAGKNPLSDVRVRQALAMSIDKVDITNRITRMGELPARTYLPPDGTLPDFVWQPGPFDAGRKEPYTFKEVQAGLTSAGGIGGDGPGLPYDLARARQLMAEAGYPNGAGFPRLPILYNTSSPVRRQICQVLKDQWKKALNIDVDIQGIEGKIFQQTVSKKDYAIATTAWYGDYPDVSTFTDKYKSTSLQNDSAWERPAYDKLCEQAAAEPDEKKRIRMLSEAEHMIDTEVPIIPIYHYVNINLIRPYVHGVEPNPRNMTVFKDVWVDRK